MEEEAQSTTLESICDLALTRVVVYTPTYDALAATLKDKLRNGFKPVV